MKPATQSKRPTGSQSKGFALVVSLSMLVLLTLVAVGLLSLSAITLRTTTQSSAQAEAQANARLALMIAIGELQKQVGPDQRITANSDIVSTETVQNRHWTGVWDSWIAGPIPGTVMGKYPSAPSHHQTVGVQEDAHDSMRPDYTKKNAHFRSWLLSLNPAEADDLATPQNLALAGERTPGRESQAVVLVGEGSLGEDNTTGTVSARLLPVKDDSSNMVRGRYGWWVGDESQKARIMNDSHETEPSNTVASRLFRQQAPGSMGTNTIVGLENVANSRQLSALPSLLSAGLLNGATPQAARNFHSATPHSFSVLADVREGGLKRDLSTLLERPISISETGNDFMLYKFNTKDQWMSGNDNQEAVPIQDLAAYYQLYDSNRTGWRTGLQYNSNLITNGMQVVSPNYGVAADTQIFAREYTTLYRQPMPVKIQFLLSMFAEPIIPTPVPTRENPTPDTHYLRIGITPSVTLWNPNNVPMVMRFDASNPDFHAQMMRLGNLPLNIRWIKNRGQANQFISTPQHIAWFRGTFDGNKPEILSLYFSGRRAIRFEPGEVKTFSLPFSGDVSGIKASAGLGGHWTQANNMSNFFFKTDRYFEPFEVHAGWEPRSFMLFNNSSPGGAPHVVNNRMVFKSSDKISFEITGNATALGNADLTRGGALSFMFIQSNYQDFRYAAWGRRHFRFNSRQGTGAAHQAFNQTLFTKGFPGQSTMITAAERSGSQLISRSPNMDGWPFLQFSLQADVETHEGSNGGIAGGRKFASRPFLHASALAAPYIDDHTGNAFYNSGWNWSINEINEVFEAPVQVTKAHQGYFGGGYTPEYGTTHVVQRQIPVVPPIAIADLSHAHLGGFSVANEAEGGNYYNQHVTAFGQAGLFPHTLQAIGNSYAHPLIPAERAFTKFSRTFFADDGNRDVTLADHSYLANKALWDEFFFSSITPQPSSVRAFGGSGNRTAKEVAERFFNQGEKLPNRRLVAYDRTMTRSTLDQVFARPTDFRNGLADMFADFLMVEAPFIINSASVDAWRTLFSSLKGKPVAYLDRAKALNGSVNPDESVLDGTPVGFSSMPNGRPTDGSNDPQDPAQWYSWRELNENEIDELAEAMVRQVKLRGPFLSLSEFVNRRLDGTNRQLAVKGALQAALDDPGVSINAGFRNRVRQFGSEANAMSPAFREALDGPVAYGSAAYVDQADLLRNFAAELTPRGDTFVIRTYGDSLDKSGKVVARAWCEAVVQRTPEYFDPADQAHLRQVELTSEANRNFGRKLEIVSFRWLNGDEV